MSDIMSVTESKMDKCLDALKATSPKSARAVPTPMCSIASWWTTMA